MNGRPARPLTIVATPGRGSLAQVAGVWLLMAYLFFLQSRLLDFTMPQLHVPLVILFALVLFAAVTGNFLQALRTSVGQLLFLFVFLMGLSTVFSINRRESASVTIGDIRHLILYVAMMALLVSIRDIRRCFQAIAWGTLVAAILGYVFNVTVEGQRLGLAVGRFGDPNDYAMVLVMGLPFWLSTGILRYPVGVPAAAVIMTSFSRAGSRGGLLAFCALTTAYFFTTSFMGKLRVALLVVIVGISSLIIVPAGIRQRYVTLFSADETTRNSSMEAQMSFIESSNSRKDLLISSLKATALHPIFGIGPGNFPQFHWQQGFVEEKRNRLGQHTHNTFTQVSAEAGIPSAICLIAILFLCFRMAWRASTEPLLAPTHPIRICGRTLWLSMVAWTAAAMFLSTAWTEVIFLYGAFAGALAIVRQNTLATLPGRADRKAAPDPPLAPRPAAASPALRPTI